MRLILLTLFLVSTAYSAPRAHPLLQWKYGWKDGQLANTIGQVSQNDPLPTGLDVLPPDGYAPTDIQGAYGFNKIPINGDGRGQTIAIIVAYGSPTIQSDLDAFCSQFGIPSTPLTIVYPDGNPDISDNVWAGETSLDVEWAHALAPSAKILLVVSKDASLENLLLAVKYATENGANIVSMSWGGDEFDGVQNEDSDEYKAFTNSLVTYVSGAGDNGTQVMYPGVHPNVLSVGGTSLDYSSLSNTIHSETAWTYSGGGISSYMTSPDEQQGWNTNSMRGVPDVSAVADPYTGAYVYSSSSGTPAGWSIIGGTSWSGPIWAALLACRASLGSPMDGLHTRLYNEANIYYNKAYSDITEGYNINKKIYVVVKNGKLDNTAYYATNGYDYVTGLGTPRAEVIAKPLIGTGILTQTISSFDPIPIHGYGEKPFSIRIPEASSGLPVHLSVVSGPATIFHNKITLTGIGTVVVAADQPGSDIYAAAAQVKTSFEVKTLPTLVLPTGLSTNGIIGANFTLTGSASGEGPFTYQWSRNNKPISGATNMTLDLGPLSSGAGGYYSLQVNDKWMLASSQGTFVIPSYARSQVRVWGSQTTPLGPSNAVAITKIGFEENGLALLSDGTVQAIGKTPQDYVIPSRLTNIVQISGGQSGVMALRSDGTVIRWGNNSSGQNTIPKDLTNVISVSEGWLSSLALKSDGTVVGWGDNGWGETTVPSNLTNVIAIVAGMMHSMALKSDGTVIAWGHNGWGETNVPTDLTNVIAIAADDWNYRSFALKRDGTIISWGGTTAVTNQVNIANFPGGTYNFLNADYNQVVSTLDNQGNAWAWDPSTLKWNSIPADLGTIGALALKNSNLKMAIRDATQDIPPSITSPPTNQTISTGSRATLTVQAIGTSPFFFQWYGNGVPISNGISSSFTTPQLTTNESGASYHVMIWNGAGAAVSSPAQITVLPPPVISMDSGSVTHAMVGKSCTLSTHASGQGSLTYQWFKNNNPIAGEVSSVLNLGSVGASSAGYYSVTVTDASTFSSSQGTFLMPCYERSEVRIWANPHPIPTNLSVPYGLTNAVEISAGDNYALALLSNGTVKAWGDNTYGQCNLPAGLSNVVHISAGYDMGMALRSDGTVIEWGNEDRNYSGWQQPPGISNVISIARSSGDGDIQRLYTLENLGFSLALKKDGTLTAWGGGPIAVPEGLTNVVALAAGATHGLALKNDGTVVAFGNDDHGQIDVPAGLTNVVAIAAGGFISMALTSSGQVVTWGGVSNSPAASFTNATIIAASDTSSCLVLGSNGSLDSLPFWLRFYYPQDLRSVVGLSLGQTFTMALRDASSDPLPAVQTIASFDPIPDQRYSNGATLSISPPAASSGYPVSLSILSGPATISGNTVTLTGAGTVVLAADQAGNNTFATATQVSTSFTITPGFQSITFSPIPAQIFGNSPITLNAAADSGLPVSWSSSSSNVSLASNVVTILGAGTATIVASQSGNSNYLAATPVTNTLVIGKGNASVNFSGTNATYDGTGKSVVASTVPTNLSVGITYNGASTVPSNAGSYSVLGIVNSPNYQGSNSTTLVIGKALPSFSFASNSLSWSYTGSNAAAGVTNAGSVPYMVTYNGLTNAPTRAGTYTVVARVADTNNYLDYAVTNTLVIAKSVAMVAITGTNVTYSGTGKSVVVTTTPIGLSNQVTYNGLTNFPVNAGSYPVVASVTDANYSGSGTATLTIAKASNVITFGALGSLSYSNGLTTNLGASASSGLTVTYSSRSTNVNLSSNKVTILGAGTATIVASQSGNSNYLAATPVTNTLVIKRTAIVAITGTHAVYTGSGQRVIVTTTPIGLSNQVTYNGLTNLPVNAGSYPVVASVTDANYSGSCTATLTIAKASNVITFGVLSPVVNGSSSFGLSATASSGLPVSYSSGSSNIALKGNIITVLGAGTATITASQPGNTNWNAAKNVTRTLVVTGAVASTNVTAIRITGVGLTNTIPTITVRPSTFPLARPANFGKVVSWGNDTYGQTNLPAVLTNVVQLSTRGLHNLALRTNGTVAAWGWNAYGQTNVPAVATNVVQVAAGVSFSSALIANGTVVAWGNNSLAQTNVPAGLTNAVQIAAGSDHAVALRRDGTVTAWGWNDYGQATVPANAANVVQVAAGYFHSVALRANGTVLAWGDNTYGETNVPAGLTNVVRIATGLNHTVALKGDGTVVVWGWNNAGQTNVPAGLSGVAQIASGGNTVFAVTTNGTLYTWGDNSFGQRKPPAGVTGVLQFVIGLYHALGLKR